TYFMLGNQPQSPRHHDPPVHPRPAKTPKTHPAHHHCFLRPRQPHPTGRLNVQYIHTTSQNSPCRDQPNIFHLGTSPSPHICMYLTMAPNHSIALTSPTPTKCPSSLS